MRTKAHRVIRRVQRAAEWRRVRAALFQQLTETVKVDAVDIPLKPGA
jgi:hypothetical protein